MVQPTSTTPYLQEVQLNEVGVLDGFGYASVNFRPIRPEEPSTINPPVYYHPTPTTRNAAVRNMQELMHPSSQNS